ncbi:MAG: hypothetical protein IJT32_06625 [Lachnospiraceae bacterium]|nr:hypothetical protein [Lachnospiraceae bacterium]
MEERLREKEQEKLRSKDSTEEARRHLDETHPGQLGEIDDLFETEDTISDREAQAVLRSDNKTPFGEGSYDYIRDFSRIETSGAKILENAKMKNVIAVTKAFNNLMNSGFCPDGIPDQRVMEALKGNAADQVIAACDAFLQEDEAAMDRGSARKVLRLKNAVSEEREDIEDHIFAYLAKHPSTDRGEGVETDPSKALETRARDEVGVNSGTAHASKQLTGMKLGDGRDPSQMSFADIVLAVESGEGGYLVKRDADSYRRSVKVTLKIKGNKTEEQRRFFQVAKELGVGGAVPVRMNSDNGAYEESERDRFIDYRTLTERQRMDEVKFSPEVIRQLTMIKSLGFLLGIADWQHIVDPEDMLYKDDEKDRPVDLRIKEMQGSTNVQGKISRQEAERFVKQFDKSRDANALKDLAANFGNQLMMRRLASMLRINPDRLYHRMETLFFCIKAFTRTGTIETVPNKYFA